MKTIIIILITFLTSFAQEYTVEKFTGTVKVLKGSAEKWENIKLNDKLSENDLVLAEDKSSLTLLKNDQKFVLKSNAAIGINHIRKVSINDLILALTLEEIRNVPKIKRNNLSKNTAVYGTEIAESNISVKDNDLGEKKINGAKILNESGYRESSLIAAREVFRNYPDISTDFNSRIYFANVLIELGLYQEALSEFQRINKLKLTNEEKAILYSKNEEISNKIAQNN
ncbi:MAG: hypothetical protein OQJ81_05875 [Melioribacteraceae bacterium]|nr:hypothetical protein [Melioribacteraceae bacterium]